MFLFFCDEMWLEITSDIDILLFRIGEEGEGVGIGTSIDYSYVRHVIHLWLADIHWSTKVFFLNTIRF